VKDEDSGSKHNPTVDYEVWDPPPWRPEVINFVKSQPEEEVAMIVRGYRLPEESKKVPDA
jgi:hypothetical protein